MGINKMRGTGTPLQFTSNFLLMEIAKHWQIDQETGRRLETSMDSEFKSTPIRYFGARK
jgi:hypothetical protein